MRIYICYGQIYKGFFIYLSASNYRLGNVANLIFLQVYIGRDKLIISFE